MIRKTSADRRIIYWKAFPSQARVQPGEFPLSSYRLHGRQSQMTVLDGMAGDINDTNEHNRVDDSTSARLCNDDILERQDFPQEYVLQGWELEGGAQVVGTGFSSRHTGSDLLLMNKPMTISFTPTPAVFDSVQGAWGLWARSAAGQRGIGDSTYFYIVWELLVAQRAYGVRSTSNRSQVDVDLARLAALVGDAAIGAPVVSAAVQLLNINANLNFIHGNHSIRVYEKDDNVGQRPVVIGYRLKKMERRLKSAAIVRASSAKISGLEALFQKIKDDLARVQDPAALTGYAKEKAIIWRQIHEDLMKDIQLELDAAADEYEWVLVNGFHNPHHEDEQLHL